MRLSTFVAGLGWVSIFSLVLYVAISTGAGGIILSAMAVCFSIASLASIIAAKKEPTRWT